MRYLLIALLILAPSSVYGDGLSFLAEVGPRSAAGFSYTEGSVSFAAVAGLRADVYDGDTLSAWSTQVRVHLEPPTEQDYSMSLFIGAFWDHSPHQFDYGAIIGADFILRVTGPVSIFVRPATIRAASRRVLAHERGYLFSLGAFDALGVRYSF